MPILEPKSVCPGVELPQVREDYQQAARVAQYRVSDRAFYFPAFPANQYIPFQAVTGVVVRSSVLSTIGCCGKELPVIKVIFRYEGGEKEVVVDPPKHVDTILERFRATRPDLAVDDRR